MQDQQRREPANPIELNDFRNEIINDEMNLNKRDEKEEFDASSKNDLKNELMRNLVPKAFAESDKANE